MINPNVREPSVRYTPVLPRFLIMDSRSLITQYQKILKTCQRMQRQEAPSTKGIHLKACVRFMRVKLK
jgi:hypothetical protein